MKVVYETRLIKCISKIHIYVTGEAMCFHNFRVLHGRDGFEVLSDGERHLEGGYIDWDELHSRRRVLQRELGILPQDVL